MGKSSAARKGKRGAKEVIEKVRLKKQKKNEGKMQAIEKLKSETKTHQKTIKKEKASTKKQKKNDVSGYLKFRMFNSRAKAAKQACASNPDDIQNLKKWAFALTEMTSTLQEYKINKVEFLQAAQLKLEHVLKIDSNDHDAIFYLGMVHYLFMHYDTSVYQDDEVYLYHCTKAIEYFEAFQDDLIYQAPEDHHVSRMRIAMNRKLRFSPYPKHRKLDTAMKDTATKDSDKEDSDTEDYDFTHEEHLWDKIRVAKIENVKNPENVENLRSWAHAMIELSHYTTVENKKQKLYTEAIAKLEQAYKINKKDKKLRLELLFARLEFEDNGEEKDDTLVKEYKTLYEELNPHLNEENSSSWTLKTCQRNRKAVSSEDDEKPEVGFKPNEYKDLYKELNPQLNDSESVELQDQSRVSKTLFVANLPYSIEQADIDNFFKDAGKVVEIRFSLNAKGEFKGYGDVEFDTVEAAHKAVELNDEELMGRPLRIEIVKENKRAPCACRFGGLCRGIYDKSNFSFSHVSPLRANEAEGYSDDDI